MPRFTYDCQEEKGMQKLIPYHKAKGVRKKEHQSEGLKTMTSNKVQSMDISPCPHTHTPLKYY